LTRQTYSYFAISIQTVKRVCNRRLGLNRSWLVGLKITDQLSET